MKKFSLVLLALIAIFGFVACTTPTNGDPTVEYSKWWIKGSFDNWSGGDDGSANPTDNSRHFFAIDPLNANKLTYEITGLHTQNYEFVVNGAGTAADGSGSPVFQLATADAKLAANSAKTMMLKGTGASNPNFDAAYTSYTVEVDISNAAAPVVKIIPGATASAYYTAAELAAGLKVKGDQFTIGWTDTAGTFDGTDTVHFAVTAANKNGSFGFSSLSGFLKNVTVASPTATGAANATASAALSTSGGNCQITGIPNSDSAYDLAVTITPPSSSAAASYSLVVTLSALGTTPWAFVAPANIYLNGDVNTAGWTDVGVHDAVAVTAGVATFTYTAGTAGTKGWKYYMVDEATWNNMTGIGGVATGTAASGVDVPIGGADNIEFTASAGVVYTIVVDFSGTYVTTGKPVVTISHP